MPDQLPPEFPLSITILCYVAVALLCAIFLMMFRINGQIALLSHRLRKNSGSRPTERATAASSEESSDSEAPSVEVGPGTPFEEFLNEDPKHRTLPKKEQFKEYRKWRADKGLNWSK